MKTNAAHEGIIVLGAPRSGTTLMRRILNAHPDIACPGETNIFSACARFLHSETISEGVDIGVLSGLEFAGFSEEEVLAALRELAFHFHREYARKQGKPRWASKTAFDLFHLDAIEKLCGAHAKFVCIQRHGLDVACSIQELCETNGGYLSELHEYIKRHPRPLEAFSHVWVDLNTALRAFVERHPENALLLRYEDLVAAPEPTLRKTADFVEVPWHDDWLGNAMQKTENVGLGDWKTYSKGAVEAGSIARWRKLSRHAINNMGKICNPLLLASGYEAVPVEPERTPQEARRRYEIGLRLRTAQDKKSS
jgi:protein-tyrosine sulfotransferase